MLRLLLIAGLVVPTAALLSALPASAATPLKCTLAHTTGVSPGLEQPPAGDATDDIQTFSAATALTACTGLSGITKSTSGPAVLKSVLPLKPACVDLTKNGNYAQGSATITWSNGKTSKSTNLRVTVDGIQKGKLSGTIATGTAGGTETRLRGKAISGQSDFKISKGACSDASPVTQLKGTGGTFQLG